MISGLAEYCEMVPSSKQGRASAAKAISGKFKVVRMNFPHEEKPSQYHLRQARRVHDQRGPEFQLPPDEKVDSNKDDLSGLMELFSKKYPNHGLLLVVDELLLSPDPANSTISFSIWVFCGKSVRSAVDSIPLHAGLQRSLFDNRSSNSSPRVSPGFRSV